MSSQLRMVSCQENKVIKKFVRDVPCAPMKPKKKRQVPCQLVVRKCTKQVEEEGCCNQKRVQPEICGAKQPETCPPKQPETCPLKQPEICPAKEAPRCVRNPICPGKERKVSGCPKCESNRIQKLECEVYQLRKEIECMKYEKKETEKALQKAILRSAKALGGRTKPMIPDSVENLLDTCESYASSGMSISACVAKNPSMLAPVRPCQNKPSKRKEEIEFCENCCL